MTKALRISVLALALAACGDAQGERATAPTATPLPSVSLAARLDRTPGTVRITAQLTNATDRTVFYMAGCSALCRPELFRAVSFQVTGPDGAEVIVKSNDYPDPCGDPLLCAEFEQQISPGESLEDVLEIDGTAWKQGSTGGGYCGVCTADPFKAGRYTVTAEALYFTDPESVDTSTRQVETGVEFDWP